MIEGVPEGINSTIGQNGTSDSPVLEPSDESNLEPPVAVNGMFKFIFLVHFSVQEFYLVQEFEELNTIIVIESLLTSFKDFKGQVIRV